MLLLRYFEASGKIRKAISVAKRQSGNHEKTIRELVTGYGQPEDQARAKEAGFDQHVTKPPAIETLAEVLARRRGRAQAHGCWTHAPAGP